MSEDTGTILERRAHRLAWKLGYFVRRRVRIHTDDGDLITDIDVVGIKFDEMITPQLIIFETKHEKGFSSILKMRGFLDYYKSRTGYIIRSNLPPSVAHFAEQLNLRGMPISRLDEIEGELKISKGEWDLGFSAEADEKIITLLGELRRSGYRRETYLRHSFWTGTDPFYRVKVLKENISRLAISMKGIEQQNLLFALEWLILDLCCLFSVAILESAGVLYTIPEHQRQAVFSQRLISGKLSYEEKERLMDSFYNFLAGYARELKKPLPIKREHLTLLPDYADRLYDMLSRFIKKPEFAKEVPRALDIYLNFRLHEKEIKPVDLQGELMLTQQGLQFVLKFARDVIQFLFGKDIPKLAERLMVI